MSESEARLNTPDLLPDAQQPIDNTQLDARAAKMLEIYASRSFKGVRTAQRLRLTLVTWVLRTKLAHALKRLLDVAIGGAALLLAAPIMLATAVAIKIDSPGPVFFQQTRVGRYGRAFACFKFRSMYVDAEQRKAELLGQNEADGPVFKIRHDPRITRVGRFIRATRIDELPQLFNVIIGNMSIVGPRPERLFFVEKLKKELPEYIHRSNVKPGITGMAQVYGKYSTTPYSKLVYDLIYIQHCNVVTDLALMLKTFRVLFFKSHAGVVDEEALSECPSCGGETRDTA